MKYNNRKKPRRQLRYRAWIQDEVGGPNRLCHLEDVSEGGARLRIEDGATIPAAFNLLLNEQATARPCRVVWRTDTEVGLRFAEPATRSNCLKRPLGSGR
jgi:hypothetical protein